MASWPASCRSSPRGACPCSSEARSWARGCRHFRAHPSPGHSRAIRRWRRRCSRPRSSAPGSVPGRGYRSSGRRRTSTTSSPSWAARRGGRPTSCRCPDDPDGLRFGNSRNHGRIKWAVNKASKEGVEVRVAEELADVKTWYPLYLRTMREVVVPPRSLRLFEAMWRELAPKDLMRLYVAEQKGEMLAGSIVLGFGRTAFYAFNGRLRSALALRPNEVLQWEAIHDACRRGFKRYDLGEVTGGNEGLAEFKRKWGADEVQMHRYYHPPPEPDAGDARRRGRNGEARRDVGVAAASARIDAPRGRPGLQVAVTARRMSQLGGTTSAGDAGRALALAARPGRLIDGPAIERYEAELARCCGGRARDRLRRGKDRAVRDPARAGRRRGGRGDRPAADPHRRHERRQVPRREAGLRRLPALRLQRRSRQGRGADRAAHARHPRAAHVRHTRRHGVAARDRRRARPAADRGLRARARRHLARAARGRHRQGGLLQHGGDEDHLDHHGRRGRDERRAARRGRARVSARVPAARALADREAAGEAGGVLRAHRAPRPHPRSARLRSARRTAAAARADHRGGARRRTAGALRGAARCGPGRYRAAGSSPGSARTSRIAAGSRRTTPPRSARWGS